MCIRSFVNIDWDGGWDLSQFCLWPKSAKKGYSLQEWSKLIGKYLLLLPRLNFKPKLGMKFLPLPYQATIAKWVTTKPWLDIWLLGTRKKWRQKNQLCIFFMIVEKEVISETLFVFVEKVNCHWSICAP